MIGHIEQATDDERKAPREDSHEEKSFFRFIEPSNAKMSQQQKDLKRITDLFPPG